MPTQLLPATLSPAESDTASQELRVRIYAGADFRARIVGWEEELDLVVAASSALLQRSSGTRLVVVETIDWKRSGGRLDKTLKSLRSLDRGVDVDLVVGLIDAPQSAELAYAQLLGAQLLGRHLVVRSFNRQAESAALGDAAAGLDELTKDQLLDRRRRHKQALLLATGIARVYGGPDTGDYSSDQTALDAKTDAILKLTIPAHLRASEEGADAAAIWTEVGKALEALQVRPELVLGVQTRGEGGSQRGKAKDDPDAALRDVDREKLANVRNLLKEARAAAAWEVLEPLTELYPDEPSVVTLACSAAFARKAEDALERCQLATGIDKGDAQAWLRVGRLQLKAEPAAARKALDQAAKFLAENEAGWGALARSYQELSLVSLALEAAGKTKGATAVVKWARQSQSRYGVNLGVSNAREGEYLVALQAALKQVYKNDYKGARLAADSLQSKFPKSIARDLITCEVHVRRRKYAGARASCEAVIARHAGNAWARYLLGIVSLREKKEAGAIPLFEAAIEKDPTLKAAYEALAQVYAPRSDARLAPLKAKYKQVFGKDLR